MCDIVRALIQVRFYEVPHADLDRLRRDFVDGRLDIGITGELSRRLPSHSYASGTLTTHITHGRTFATLTPTTLKTPLPFGLSAVKHAIVLYATLTRFHYCAEEVFSMSKYNALVASTADEVATMRERQRRSAQIQVRLKVISNLVVSLALALDINHSCNPVGLDGL